MFLFMGREDSSFLVTPLTPWPTVGVTTGNMKSEWKLITNYSGEQRILNKLVGHLIGVSVILNVFIINRWSVYRNHGINCKKVMKTQNNIFPCTKVYTFTSQMIHNLKHTNIKINIITIIIYVNNSNKTIQIKKK